MCCAWSNGGVVRFVSLAAKGRDVTRQIWARYAKLWPSHAGVVPMKRGVCACLAQLRDHAWHSGACVAMSDLVREAATARRPDALWTIQSQLPAWTIALHACPRGCAPSPRARIRPPRSMVFCRRADRLWRVEQWIYLAWSFPPWVCVSNDECGEAAVPCAGAYRSAGDFPILGADPSRIRSLT